MDRARVASILSRLLAGALLGALGFLAVYILGVPDALHIYGFTFFWPSVVVGALLYVSPLRPVGWGILVLLVGIVMVTAYTPLVANAARGMIRTDAVRPVDAVVVLSSGVNDDGFVSPDALDRLVTGAALARDPRAAVNGAPPAIAVTTVIQQRSPNRSSVGDQRFILSLLADTSRVFWTPRVISTRDEALMTRTLARAQGWSRLAVVTSPLHTSRACRTFERAGMDIVCVASASRGYAANTMRIPSDRLVVFGLWLAEVAAGTYYRMHGWM